MLKTKKLFFLLIFLLMQVHIFAHPYYVSLCQINFNDRNQNVELSVKIFADDLMKALKNEGAPELYLGEDRELPQADSLINEYILNSFTILTNNEHVELNYVGKEMDTNALWCYFESGKIATSEQVEVRCELLTEIYNSQSNIIQITKNNKTRNMLLNKQKTEDKLRL